MGKANLMVKDNTRVFSPRQFGEHLRDMRRESGFSSVDSFSKSIADETGVKIDRESLLRIERGQLVPDLSKFVAICYTIAETRPGEQLNEFGVVRELLTYSKPTAYLLKSDSIVRETLKDMGASEAAIDKFVSESFARPEREASEDLKGIHNVAAAIVRLESFSNTLEDFNARAVKADALEKWRSAEVTAEEPF